MAVSEAPTSSPSAPSLEVTHVSQGLLMASIGPVCLALWNSKPSPETFEIQRDRLAAAVAASPGKSLFLCVVEAQSPPPDEQLREASSAMITAHGAKLRGCACVIEGRGFDAAITHTVLSGIVHGIHSPAPIRFFDTIGLACSWLEALLPVGSPEGVVRRVEEARSRLRAFKAA